MNDFLIIFHEMISISDGLCKLGYIKCYYQLKLIKAILIILTNFACIVLRLARKILNNIYKAFAILEMYFITKML